MDTITGHVSARIDRFLAQQHPPPPCIILDLEVVRDRYRALKAALPFAEIYYAVKANPAVDVIAALAEEGASFDLASAGELDRCLTLKIPGSRLSFGNTVKREKEIAHAYAAGIRLFAFDSAGELEKLARAAPGARVFCRMLVESTGAEWPLTHKFGCDPTMATELLIEAGRIGLRPAGVSFHVGSQQTDPQQWVVAIARAAGIFRACAAAGIELDLLNLGGGLPAQYRSPVPSLATYGEAIATALGDQFRDHRPRILIEPGRHLVGDAGLLRATVLLVARKSAHAKRRWVYLDAGRYNGLTETLGERIHYRLRTPRDGSDATPVILAGPTCDSTDIIYERSGYALPIDLAIGDCVDFLSAGAYTGSYASVEFNGFPPLRTYCI